MFIKEKVGDLLRMMNSKNNTIKKKINDLLDSLIEKESTENKPPKKPPTENKSLNRSPIKNESFNSKNKANVIISVKDSNMEKDSRTYVTLAGDEFNVTYS
jgi:hypothetical protein